MIMPSIGETISNSLKQVNAPKKVKLYETVLNKLMHLKPLHSFGKILYNKCKKNNVDSAIKLITNNMENGILPLTDTTLGLLKQKHTKSATTTEEVVLPDQSEGIHQIKYENIHADSSQACTKKQNWFWTFGMDDNDWKRILTTE